MLIFSRCIGQTLKIGDDIALTVLAINNNQVQIRFAVAQADFTLTGGPGQSLRIADDVTISVLVVRAREIRLGVEAAARISVYRLETANRFGLHGVPQSGLN